MKPKKKFSIADRWVYVGSASGPDGQGGASQVLAAHAALLPYGDYGFIFYFSGSQWTEDKEWEAIQNEPDPTADPNYPEAKAEIDHTRIFDCQSHQISNPYSPDADLFCCGHAFLPDGRLLLAGGTQHFPYGLNESKEQMAMDWHHLHWSGSRATWIFDFPDVYFVKTEEGKMVLAPGLWVQGPPLNTNVQGNGGGRWYPAVITLASGNIFAHCGHPMYSDDLTDIANNDQRHNNTTPEIFNLQTGEWQLIDKPLGVDGAHNYSPYYPRFFVVPFTDEIFCVQPLYSKTVKDPLSEVPADNPDLISYNPLDTNPPYNVDVFDKSFFYDVERFDITRAFDGPQILDINKIYLTASGSQETTAVMLPLLHEDNYNARILLCGGETPLIADLSDNSGWKATAPRKLIYPFLLKDRVVHPVRIHANLTLLPNGTVALTGGVIEGSYDESDGVKAVEIYYPSQAGQPDRWEVSAEARETRGYHSVALLMPDGRIWTAGSQFNDTSTPNLAIEIFEPSYYHHPDRIQILQAPLEIGYGEIFKIKFVHFQEGVTVMRVVLMRLGSATHAFDGDQRYISIPFEQFGLTIRATAPPEGSVAPPGYYMLWLVDSKNQPCMLAKFVRVYAKWVLPRRHVADVKEPPARHF